MDQAIAALKDEIQKMFGKKSEKLVSMNHAAVDATNLGRNLYLVTQILDLGLMPESEDPATGAGARR